MVDGASVTVPPQIILPIEEDFDALRERDSDIQINGQPVIVAGAAASLFRWSPLAVDVDNDETVIRPDDRAPLQAGRWLAAIYPLTISEATEELIQGYIDEAQEAAQAADASAIDASNSAALAQAAIPAALAAEAFPNGAATNVPQGVTSAGAITPGSGGTNGTFALGWSGGNFLNNPTGTFTVAGGVLTAVSITNPGTYIGASPTAPTATFAASSGLTGAAVALNVGFLVGTTDGYWVQSADNSQIDRYKNVAGVATADPTIGPLPTVQGLDDAFAALEGIPEVLVGYTDADVTYGTSPITGTANALDALSSNGVLLGNTVDKQLQGINAFVMTVGDGTAFLDIIQINPDGSGTRINRAALTGIASTGLKNFAAGTDFAEGLVVPPNCYAMLGSASGGTKFATTVVGGTGVSVPTTAAGVAIIVTTNTNFRSNHQVVLADPVLIKEDVDQVRVMAADGALAAYGQDEELFAQDGSVLPFTSVGDQSLAVPLSSAMGFLESGPLAAVEYQAVQTGDAEWHVRRGASPDAKYVGSGRFTISTTGSRVVYNIPEDEQVDCLAGDYLFFVSHGGRVATQTYNNQLGVYPQNNFDYTGATYTDLARRPAFRGFLRRPKSNTDVAIDAARRWTCVVNQNFVGTSLPAGWTGTGGTFTANDGLISPGSGGWTTHFSLNLPTSANIRKGSVRLTMTTATSVGGLSWKPQTLANGLGGMIVHVDASAGAGSAVLKAYAWDGATSGTGAKSVAIPWTITAGSKIALGWSYDTGTTVITATNPVTGQVATLTVQYGDATNSGVPFGQIGAHFYSGSMRWGALQSWTPIADIISMGDSIPMGALHGDLMRYSWANQIIAARAKGDMLNCSLASATTASALACLPMELLANPRAKVVWSVGVNAYGANDAARYANYVADTQAAKVLAEAGGGTLSITTPTPFTSLSTYVQMVRDGVIAGSVIGPCDYANLTDVISVSNAGAAMQTAYTYDGLHPIIAGDAILSASAQRQLACLAA